METMNSREQELTRSSSRWNPYIKISHIGLRVIAIGFATTSIATMLASHQEIYLDDHVVVAKAHYTYSSALWYKMIVDAVIGVYSLVSLIVVHRKIISFDREAKLSFYFYLMLIDAVMMALMLSGSAAATGVGFVALFGVEKPGISWAPICSLARKFCEMATVSVVSSYVAFGCMALLMLISACKLKLHTTQ
uniref:CASP-like protein 1F2 n=1 Tax=Erigeron canadensis TaxID=72917 RepID=UPI001CB9B2CB|nr:CASP-like protein 1F2 [Erigeron canadensis]